MRFKIDWASLTDASKFTVFAMFYFVFEAYLRAISKYKPPPGGGGGLYLEGDLTEGFFRYRFGGLIFEGAYTWRVYFRNLTVSGLRAQRPKF